MIFLVPFSQLPTTMLLSWTSVVDLVVGDDFQGVGRYALGLISALSSSQGLGAARADVASAQLTTAKAKRFMI